MSSDRPRQNLPWGLNPESITPGSMKTISAEKLKAFSVGNMNSVKQKSSVIKKKEELEERKRVEERKQAKVYEEFVREFEHDAPKVKTFVKGDVINSSSRASDKGKLYNPAGMKRMEEITSARLSSSSSTMESSNKKPEKPKKKQKEQEKKKSNLELFKEELKQQQAEREERHRLKKLGIIPMSAPEMIGTGFQPAPTVNEQLQNREMGGALSSKLTSLSYDSSIDDPDSTNLYVGNLSMKIDEEQLCKIFGLYGPLASIKIMWPRNDEERKRDRNCGFVAYMQRCDAEKAQLELNGKELEGYAIRVGWGSSVPIPPHPVYIPPHLAGDKTLACLANTGLPFNAVPRKSTLRQPLVLPANQHDANELLRECIVYVVVPHDKAMLNRINRMAQFVLNEGPIFEAMIMNKELNNPKFEFLFDNKSADHCYYRWRLYSLLQGEIFTTWRTEEFRMFKNGSMWKPPPRHTKSDLKIIKKAIESAAAAATTEVQKRGQLSNQQRDKLEDMLRGLTVERECIGSCMHWCLQHADAAEEIVECIGESLSILQTPPTVKAARLFLCNDLLYNSCAEVQNASSYRTKLESKLAEIVVNLKETLQEVKSSTMREKFKAQVLGSLKAWRDWNVYSPDFLMQLDLIFLGGKRAEPDPDEVDGIPLDVDGVPLAKDVDGIPLEEEKKSDSEPEDDDMFDLSPKSKKSAPSINSKWEDSAPSLGSKWEKNTFAPSLGSKWETSTWEEKGGVSKGGISSETASPKAEDGDARRKKKREIEVKVAEYVDKLESGKCTRIKEITTNDQTEMYRYLLYKGKDAKKTIKHIATGKVNLSQLQEEMKREPVTSPVLKQKKRKGGAATISGLGGLVSYGSSPASSPSPEHKRKREPSDKKKRSAVSSPKHERKKKSRH